jgi:tetratricopeptide (TPR) repeat protein
MWLQPLLHARPATHLVTPCICICNSTGACGSGPNVAVIPLDGTAPLVLRHVSTPQRAADMLREVCCAQVDESLLKATELRLAGNAAARSGDLKRACALYTVGLELDPPGGRHLLLSNRSGVRLELGDAEGALEDATAATECAPPGFTTAAIRQVEALLRLQRFRAAMECLLAARQRHPGFAETEDYHRCVADVQAALEAADVQP